MEHNLCGYSIRTYTRVKPTHDPGQRDLEVLAEKHFCNATQDGVRWCGVGVKGLPVLCDVGCEQNEDGQCPGPLGMSQARLSVWRMMV